MATFAQLEARVRSEIIAEKYEDQYISADMQDDLWNSSVEIATLLGFPLALKTDAAVNAGDTIIARPSDMQQLTNVIINGDEGAFAPIARVIEERSPGQGPLRVFNFDPKRGGSIEIGPASNYTGAVTLEYVQTLTKPTPLSSASPWTTTAGSILMPEWHWLVAYHAASRFFQEAEREDEAPYWMQAYQSGLTSFAIYLGRGDVADLMMGGIKGASSQSQTPQTPQKTQQVQQQLGYGGMMGQ